MIGGYGFFEKPTANPDPSEDTESEPLAEWERELVDGAPAEPETPAPPAGLRLVTAGAELAAAFKAPLKATEPDDDQADALKPLDLSDVPVPDLPRMRPLAAKLPRPGADPFGVANKAEHRRQLGIDSPATHFPPRASAEQWEALLNRNGLGQPAPVIAISTGDNPAARGIYDARRRSAEPTDDHTHAVGGYVPTEEIGREPGPKPSPYLPPSEWQVTAEESAEIQKQLRGALAQEPRPNRRLRCAVTPAESAAASEASRQHLIEDVNRSTARPRKLDMDEFAQTIARMPFPPSDLSGPTPRVRVVHKGGPASNTHVYIDGRPARGVSRVLIRLAADDKKAAAVWLKFDGVDIDVSGDLIEAKADTYATPSPRLLALAGVAVTSLPVGLAWALRAQSWWLPATGFWLAATSSAVLMLGFTMATVGAIRQAKRDAEGYER